MYEEPQLRKADFITSILLIIFGGWIIWMATKMPMKATFGGVWNVWYVSPALFPLAIGAAIIILSVILLSHAIKVGGARSFLTSFSIKGLRTEKSLRFWVMILLFFSFIYLYVPRIDFFLSIVFFLMFFISIFYFDIPGLMIKLSVYYLIVTVIFLLIFITGLHKTINRFFIFGTDLLLLIFMLFYIIYVNILIGKDKELKAKFRLTVMVSFLTSLVLCPVFKYLLLVPLPKEGGIISILNLIRYTLL